MSLGCSQSDLAASSISIPTETTTTLGNQTTLDDGNFTLSSPVIQDDGILPIDYTCDGSSISPPLSWSNAPVGTTNFAVLMDHQPGEGDWHWYWTLWSIEADTSELAANSNGDAVVGSNSVNNQLAYAPPCSQGPGEKSYDITIFALSAEPSLSDPSAVNRASLLSAIADITLSRDTLTVTYSRS